MRFEPHGERRVVRRGDKAVDQAERGAEVGSRAGDLDVEVMRAEAVSFADPVGELARVMDEHLPLPCKAERVHDARDAVGACGAREIDPDAVEARRDDLAQRIVEAVFDVETGAFVEAPDRLKDEQCGQRLPFQTTLSYRVGCGSQLASDEYQYPSSCRA